MVLSCSGTVNDSRYMEEIATELSRMRVHYHKCGTTISVEYTGDEPGTIRRVRELFEALCPHSIFYSS